MLFLKDSLIKHGMLIVLWMWLMKLQGEKGVKLAFLLYANVEWI